MSHWKRCKTPSDFTSQEPPRHRSAERLGGYGAKIRVGLLLSFLLGLSVPMIEAQSNPGGGSPCQTNCIRLIGDYAWIDDNANGIQDAGEPPLPGVQVSLYQTDSAGTPVGAAWQQMLTGPTGEYEFDVADGFYVLHFAPPASNASVGGAYSLTSKDAVGNTLDAVDSDASPATGFTDVIEIDPQQNQADKWDAGFVPQASSCPDKWTLGDQLWRDMDADGLFSNSVDLPMPGVKVELWEQRWPWIVPVRSYTGLWTLTNAQGEYQFDCLEPGEYFIVVPDSGDYGVMDSTFVANPNPPLSPPPGGVNNDNNCSSNPGFEIAGDPDAISGIIRLNSASGVQSTLDCAFTCEDAPADVIMLIDISGSMGESAQNSAGGSTTKLQAAKDAAISFVNQMNPPRRVGVIGFSTPGTTVIASPLTTDYNAVRTAISGLSKQGGTHIDHGIDQAIGMFDVAGRDPDVPRFIILLSDGEQNDPPGDAAAIASATQARGLEDKIISIALGNETSSGGGGSDGDDGVDKELMADLAYDNQHYRYAPNAAQLWGVYNALLPTLCDPSGGGMACSATAPQDAVFQSLNTGLYVVDRDGHPADDLWHVDYGPGSHLPAFIVDPPHDAWTTLEPSEWISHAPDGSVDSSSYPLNPSGVTAFRTEFDLPSPMPAGLELKMDLWADDVIYSVSLNGNPLEVSSNGNFAIAPPAHVYYDEPTYFVSGTNVLLVEVEDIGGVVTGLDIEGYVFACNGERIPDVPLFLCPWRCGDPDFDLGFAWTKAAPLSYDVQYGASVPAGNQVIFDEAIDYAVDRWNTALSVDPFEPAPVSSAGDFTIHVKDLNELPLVYRTIYRLTSQRPLGQWWPYPALCSLTLGICLNDFDPTSRPWPIQAGRVPVFGGDVILHEDKGPWSGLPCVSHSGKPYEVAPLVLHELGHVIGLSHMAGTAMGYDHGDCAAQTNISAELVTIAECLIDHWSIFQWLQCTNPTIPLPPIGIP